MAEIADNRETGRLEWLDAAKGIGIVLVVIAHVWTSGIVRDTIYAFHMPLFFIVSGYVAHARPMKPFIRSQWLSMAIPYFLFLITLAAIDPLIENLRGHLPMFRSWSSAFKALALGGSELRGPLTIFWFIPCLIFSRIILNFLMLRWPDPFDWRWLLAMLLAMVLGVWAGGMTDFSPLGLLSVPVALIFLWLGACWRSMGYARWLMRGAVIVSLGLLAFGTLAPLNMKAGDYGDGLWSLAAALILSLAVCALAKLMPLRPLQRLGQMSLVIMYCHVAVIHYCAPYFAKPILLILAVTIPVFLHMFLSGTVFGQRYFLGKHTKAAQKPL